MGIIIILCYNDYMNTAVNKIDDIKEILSALPDSALCEVRDFACYLADRERKRRELVERVRKAEEKPDSVICNSVEEAMQAIYNTPDDDNEA